MKLLKLYSSATNLKIGNQFLLSKFYPLTIDKYITLMIGTGQPAKVYPYWPEVVAIIKSILYEQGISIVQIGKDDPEIPGCISLVNKTDIHQTNFILERSLSHIGSDSWPMHRAGFLNIPLVELFGSTTPENHAPYVYNKEKSIFLESHRFNRHPSFQAQENPQTISAIPPELIANSIFKILDINHKIEIQSLLFGMAFQQNVIEIVPNNILPPNYQIQNPVVIRMDYLFDEGLLVENLKLRKCIIITNKEIKPEILALHRPNIELLRVEIDNVSENWFKTLKRVGLKSVANYTLSTDEENIKKKRLELFNVTNFDQISYPKKEIAKQNVEVYLNKKLPEDFDLGKVKFKSNKFIFANDKFYLSKAHWKQNISVANTLTENSGNVIDTEDFWLDQNHYYFYKQL